MRCPNCHAPIQLMVGGSGEGSARPAGEVAETGTIETFWDRRDERPPLVLKAEEQCGLHHPWCNSCNQPVYACTLRGSVTDVRLLARITATCPAWAEDAIRLHERQRLADQLAKAIDLGEYQDLVATLRKSGKHRSLGLLVHTLTQILESPDQPDVEPVARRSDAWFADAALTNVG